MLTGYDVLTLHANGHQLGALSFNANWGGIPCVFLHDITSSPEWWAAVQTPTVHKHYPWIALSLPGHPPGRLPETFTAAALTPEHLADTIAAAIQQLTFGAPVVLVGHSYGGFAALVTAARHPHLIHNLITVNGFVQPAWRGAAQKLAELATRPRSFPDPFALVLRMLQLYRTTVVKRIGKTHVVTTHLNVHAMRIAFASLAHADISDWLPTITTPTLAIAGSWDTIVHPAQSRRIAQSVPGARLAMLEGAGHSPMTSLRARTYHAAVHAWLRNTVKRTV